MASCFQSWPKTLFRLSSLSSFTQWHLSWTCRRAMFRWTPSSQGAGGKVLPVRDLCSHVHDDVPGKLSTMDLPRCTTWGTLVLSSASSTSFWVPAQSGKLNGHLWQRNGCRGGTAFSTRILPRATKQLFQVFHMIAQCSLQKKAREDWQWVGGGLRWIAPKYVELQKHKVPGSKKIVEMKSGTQIIDQCWRFLKARIPLNHNCTVGSRTLCLKLRSAQYEYCNPGKDLWAYRCACPMVHAEHGQGCVEATMQNGGRNVLISCLH